MHTFRLLVAAVVVASLIAPAVAQDKLVAYRTRKVDIRSDADRDTVQSIATHIDRMIDGYASELGVRPSAGRERPRVYLLATHEGYLSHLRGKGLDGRASGGMFYVTREETALALPVGGESRSRTLGVVQHEAFHQFSHGTFRRGLPRWLEEGLAEYFQDALVRRGQFKTGFAPAERLDHLRLAGEQGKLLSLAQLTSLDARAWQSAMQSGRGGTIYDQSWSLVHFLRHGDGGGTERRFDRMLKELASGQAYEAALQTAFGPSGLATYEQRWLDAINGGIEPDAFSTTRDRVLFTADALRWLHREAPDRIPGTFQELGTLLKQSNYTSTSESHGVRVVRRATDPRYFPGPNASRQRPAPARLELTRAQGRDLPPGVTAVGVWPRIKLEWSRDKQGRLIDHVVFE